MDKEEPHLNQTNQIRVYASETSCLCKIFVVIFYPLSSLSFLKVRLIKKLDYIQISPVG